MLDFAMAGIDYLSLIHFHGALRSGSYVRSSPLSALAEEMGTTFDTMIEAAMDPEDEERVGWEAGIDNVIGALLTVEHQLTKTRPFWRMIGKVTSLNEKMKNSPRWRQECIRRKSERKLSGHRISTFP